MSVDLHIVKTRDFVRLDAQGNLDLNQSLQVLAKVAKTCIDRGICCALIDVRDMYSKLSATDLYKLAHVFAETGFHRDHRLAVLHRYNDGERAELFAMFASDRGWNIRAFDDYEEAIEWFTVEQPLKQNQKPADK